MPVPNAMAIDLGQYGAVFAVNAKQLLIGGRTRIGRRVAIQSAQLIACEGLDFAILLHRKCERIGYHVVEIDHGVNPIGVLQIDDLLFGLTQGVWLELEEIVGEVSIVSRPREFRNPFGR